jgi:tetratricopeptide (TPR) repeat protein
MLAATAVAVFVGVAPGCRDEKNAHDSPERSDAPPAAESEAAIDDASRARTYQQIRDRFDRDPKSVVGADFPQVRGSLMEIANGADDVHLRANASLLLGALHELREERSLAIDLYRHASKLVTDDAGPLMALALALSAGGEHAEAVEVQEKVTQLDPDNLENWLALGQMRIQAGDPEGGAQAYVDYERRRKGLIDGLTLTKDGNYLVSIDDRIACAEALASAPDLGTAVALLYALESEPEPSVRRAIVRTMGVQRLEGYRHRLESKLEKEQDPDVREALAWALAEIARDPVVAQPPPGAETVDAESSPDSEVSEAERSTPAL